MAGSQEDGLGTDGEREGHDQAGEELTGKACETAWASMRLARARRGACQSRWAAWE